jgi:hypothetical protein
MGYEEAIEAQVRLRNWWRTDHALGAAEHVARTIYPEVPNHGAHIAQGVRGLLDVAEPFYVAPDICALLGGAAATFPSATLAPQDVPVQTGWLYYSNPLDLTITPELRQQVRDVDSGRELAYVRLRGLAWAATDEHGVLLMYFADVNVGPAVPALIWYTNIPWGGTWDRGYTERLSLFTDILRHFYTFLAFVRQRLLVTARRPLLQRQERRRLTRDLGHEPFVRVVDLRARDYRRPEEAEGQPVEWSCRWLVRGHWHRYHTREGLQSRWLLPYVKGPEDKPLRVPDSTIYAVVR